MKFLNSIFDFLLNWQIFGIKPMRGIHTLLTSPSLWAIVIGVFVIVFMLNKLLGNTLVKFVSISINFVLRKLISIAKSIALRIMDVYMLIRIKSDSNKKGYLWSEFWNSRTITVKGIVAQDSTGVQNLVIKHPDFLVKAIDIALKAKRISTNLFLFIKNKFRRA